MKSSVREIRSRLLMLLIRAFVIVLTLSFLFFLGITGYFLAYSSSTPIPLPFANLLEGYYAGHGSWNGVDEIFTQIKTDALQPILLDADQRIVLDRRPDSVSTVGSRYEPQHDDIIFKLTVNDELVGYLIITSFTLAERFGLARAILLPVGIISFILILFMVIVATLLMRRFVNPLADVIYAARDVADGKLDTRLPTEGPQDLRSLSESFNAMASSLERNDRERRDMLADVAHELRTPLSVIRGRLEGIVDGIYPENGPQVSMALDQTYVLERLVEDLRLLTLAESRQLPFARHPVDLGQLVERTLEVFSAEAQEKNISLAFAERGGDLTASVDPQRFEQVLGNLVGNAIRYVPEGGRVWVTAHGAADGLSLTVNDNGPGLPPEDLPFIFDRFWRKDKSRARVSGGTGLGLAIAKQLVEAQGGQISARNLPEGGLQIVVELKRMG